MLLPLLSLLLACGDKDDTGPTDGGATDGGTTDGGGTADGGGSADGGGTADGGGSGDGGGNADGGGSDGGGSGGDGGGDGGLPDEAMPDFLLEDLNPGSVRFGRMVSPRDYLEQVSGWYFIHAT